MDLALSMEMPPPLSASYNEGDDWDNWNDEPVIELCEVRLGLEIDTYSMSTYLSPFRVRVQAFILMGCIPQLSPPIHYHLYAANPATCPSLHLSLEIQPELHPMRRARTKRAQCIF